MNPKEFEREMRKGECFHALRVPPGMWTVVRVDGRGFSRFTESRFEKPFDIRFRRCMEAAAKGLIEALGGVYAYTESDEISMLLPRDWDGFDREVEKLVSLAAGATSASFTQAAGEPAMFDARIWVGASEAAVVDYFRWRQYDATRCCLNGHCYWMLRNDGLTATAATAELDSKNAAAKQEMLFQRGINFNGLPAWQRRGFALRFHAEPRTGEDPRTGESVDVVRRVLRLDDELPMGPDYTEYLLALLRETA